MAKPLRSDNPAPQNIQFTHFGVLNDGKQSKGAFTTAIVINMTIARAAVIVIGSAVKTVVISNKTKDIAYRRARQGAAAAAQAATAAATQASAAAAAQGASRPRSSCPSLKSRRT